MVLSIILLESRYKIHLSNYIFVITSEADCLPIYSCPLKACIRTVFLILLVVHGFI